MLVKEIMSTSPQFIPPETTLEEAAETMRKLDSGFLPIGENERLIGTITDRDITIRGIAEHLDPHKTLVRDIMTDNVLYCFEDEDIKDAAKSMGKQQVHRLVVLDKDKQLKGILSLGDIATGTHDDKLCGKTIEDISEEVA